MSEERLRRKAINCLLGVSLGDRAGIETEMLTREEILAATGGRGITHPKDKIDQKLRKVPDTRGLEDGSTSDDTALTEANVEGFISAGRYDHELFALLHMRAFKTGTSGWGGTTKRSSWEIDKHYLAQKRPSAALLPPPNLSEKDRKIWKQAEPRSPFYRAMPGKKGTGRGNGIAMKAAAFPLFHGVNQGKFRPDPMLDEIMQHGMMTHADPTASLMAYAVAVAIGGMLHLPERLERINARYALDQAAVADFIIARVREAEERYQYLMKKPHQASERLLQAFTLMIEHPEAFLDHFSQKSSDALVTVPLAIGIFLRQPDDPRAAVLEAVNAGGDTDTVASMVGAMCGANTDDLNAWPTDWLAALKDHGTRATRLGEELFAVAADRASPSGRWTVNDLKRELGYL